MLKEEELTIRDTRSTCTKSTSIATSSFVFYSIFIFFPVNSVRRVTERVIEDFTEKLVV
jgi:hypothetical protein